MTILSIGGVTYRDLDPGVQATHTHSPDDVQDNAAETLDLTNLECDTLKIEAGAEMVKDAALAFVPYENGQQVSGAIYRFGRQANFGDQTQGLLDGLSFQHNLDSEDQKASLQLHPSAPSLRIEGSKDDGVDYIQVVDESGATVFAVHGDGTIETPGWGSGS